MTDDEPVQRWEDLTVTQAARVLLAAGYDRPAVQTILAEADKFPSRWAYTADRRRCVVKHMPAGDFDVADCEESEKRIAALRRRR